MRTRRPTPWPNAPMTRPCRPRLRHVVLRPSTLSRWRATWLEIWPSCMTNGSGASICSARGPAATPTPESDVDLLVVLDRIDSSWDELLRMEPVLERRSDEHGTVVCATPVSVSGFEHPSRPALIRARIEGRRVA